MSLVFTDNTSDSVNFGSAASLDQLTALTVLQWWQPTVNTTNRRVWTKRNNAAASGKQLRTGGDGTNRVEFTVWDTSGGNHVIRKTNDNAYTTNAWTMTACVYNSTGPVGRIYMGSLSANAAEQTYATSTNSGVGASDDSGHDLKVGSDGSAQGSAGMRVAVFAYVNREMTTAEIIDWQWNPRVVANTKLFSHLGHNGATSAVDWSGNGNAGTISSAGQSLHVPLGPAFGLDDYFNRLDTAAATFKPAWARAANSVIYSGARAA